MKKYLILVPFLLLAAACSKTQSPATSPSDNMNVGVSTSTPTSATGTQLSLSVYNDSQYKYKVLYSSEFELSHKPKADPAARDHFALKSDLASAAVAIKILNNKKEITDCAVMTSEDINGGHMTDSKTVNGVNFITAVSSGSGYETRYSRAWYGTFCLEIDATVKGTGPKLNDVWYKLQVLMNSFQFINK